jgi:hypothetical protein
MCNDTSAAANTLMLHVLKEKKVAVRSVSCIYLLLTYSMEQSPS